MSQSQPPISGNRRMERCLSYWSYFLLGITLQIVCTQSVKNCVVRQEVADCSHLKLTQIPPDLPTNITTLNLTHNQLKRLPAANLTRYNQLVILDGGFNSISKLEPELCQSLPLLKVLNLQHNELSQISDAMFASCISLMELHLKFNSFKKISNNPFINLKDLRILDLSHSGLSSTKLGTQVQLENLQELLLTNNNIHTLQKENFDYLSNSSLRKLDLSSNQLKEFSPGCFQSIGKLYGLSLNNVLLGPVLTEELCLELSGWRIAFYWNVTIHRVLGFKEIDHQAEKPDYAAYVVHAREDAQWIWKHFSPLEEKDSSLRFCLEERDFEAGMPELEAIVHSIKRSKKIIFVVTRNLLKDPLCKRFKVHHAVQQAIEQNLDSIILIFLEDIPDYKLNHALCLRRGLFKSQCILHWPAQKERVHAFYQKLEVALGMKNRAQ
ncbi:toll-like receptor 3 isoform X3 [Sarcophilus harrisii]|uniref:toll-like receptor 3 isoform X3 n=1 Tax=Sarcophilus harrisii TaxID=9305 RepID=UPI00062B5C0C|nr:toll-like receptor 3 isoform X3 [Sarcophilus harrisii]